MLGEQPAQSTELQLQDRLRQLPSVDSLLKLPEVVELVSLYGRELTRESIRTILSSGRASIAAGNSAVPSRTDLVDSARTWLEELLRPSLRPLINATGIIIHTNLGRAPLSTAAIEAIKESAEAYSNLEFELASGKRGSRSDHVEGMVARLAGAESALVVNNNAAAVLLMLSALCGDRDVIISRGQLVEIGGGFRLPEVMAQSGCRLVEVGTTNRTHYRDYSGRITEETAAILVVHQSNYKVVGFTSEPDLGELAELAHQYSLPLLFDQGSGALVNMEDHGLDREPMIQEAIEAGVDVVTFSGDKLVGGPQAGILCGRADYLDIIRKHPLARAVRADKLCLAALGVTLATFAKGRHTSDLPVWRMIAVQPSDLRKRAQRWIQDLRTANIDCDVVEGESAVGGGSLPGATLPTIRISVSHPSLDALARALRLHSRPVIARVREGRLLFDLRTVMPEQDEVAVTALIACARGLNRS